MMKTLADGSNGGLPVYVEETPLPSSKFDYSPSYPSDEKVQSGFPREVLILIAAVVVIILVWKWAWRK